ncbi:hypothetical protein LWI29_004781 [Acer saccharum]|uniref:HTH La-type RNA-binding domain-containing protein n=1 Tax=Acer saccharum TaxID=4024 RepID=A0AA39V6C6_ACESA|nr:hypothetical protein LWI29_004781 [Acer saccharum]
MIISPSKSVEYGRPAWNMTSNGAGAGAGTVAGEAEPLMGAYLWSASQDTGRRMANSVSQQQVSNNIRNLNSTTTTPNHTAAAAPTRPRFMFVSQSHGVNYDHSHQYISQSHHHNVQRFMMHPPPPPPPSGPLHPFVHPNWHIGPSQSHAVNFNAPDTPLQSLIAKQTEYYFSKENLIKDTYLRQRMDDHGWVPIKLIAGFNKVKLLTNNINLILDSLRGSRTVEVWGDRIRKRDDWKRWIMPPHINYNNQLQQSTSQVSVQGGSNI